MSRFPSGAAGERPAGVSRAKALAARARRAAKSLQVEYAAGKAGDDSEPEPLWGTPKEQLDSLIALLRGARAESVAVDFTDAAAAAAAPAPSEFDPDADADADGDVTAVIEFDQSDDVLAAGADDDATALADALQRVDWTRVRAATSERTGEAAEAMKAMAQQVDWGKVQPVAAQLSSALIAAVASGQLGLGGRLGPTVARAIINQGGLGHRVASKVNADSATRPPDFRGAIEASSREA